jgi:predicted TPR repeat methyltransferase
MNPMAARHTSGDLAADRRYAYAREFLEAGDAAAAADLLRQTLERVPAWPPAWFALGEAEELAGDAGAAIAAFREARALDPLDRLGAGARLARMSAIPAADAMSPAFVAGLFDQYADRFDTHLVDTLAYRGPELIATALGARRFREALDLGCGTGLVARALQGRIDAIDGVDLSPRMLEKARATGLYRKLDVGEAVAALGGISPTYDLIVAADVLVYIGDLAPLFTAVARRLTVDGRFALTVQSVDCGHYRVGPDLRCHHSAAYIRVTAADAGLSIVSLEPCCTRLDAGNPVPGLLGILRHAAAG